MITLDAVGKSYGSSVVLQDVSFQVEPGELLMLLGGSGSGKTTTLKIINRLIEPSSGRIRIAGQDTAGMRPYELRRQRWPSSTLPSAPTSRRCSTRCNGCTARAIAGTPEADTGAAIWAAARTCAGSRFAAVRAAPRRARGTNLTRAC